MSDTSTPPSPSIPTVGEPAAAPAGSGDVTATVATSLVSPLGDPLDPPAEDLVAAAPAEPAPGTPPLDLAGRPAAAVDAAEAPDSPTEATAPAELSAPQCARQLAELFPALFGQRHPRPLKLRIQADIQQRAPGRFTRKTLSLFLHRYTTGTPYLMALTRDAHRVDLDGAPAGEIAAEHRDAAAAELVRRRGVAEARRVAEVAARRQSEAAEREQRDAEQQQRRERAALLRAFETSTLTKGNFCALKGLTEAMLEAQLVQARQEAAARPPAAPQAAGPGDPRRGTPGPAQRRPPGPSREFAGRETPRRDARPPRPAR